MFFTSEPEETIQVKDLWEKISLKPHEYENIFVRRFTHVKNLESPVLHEYLHVILEDSSTDKWTRVIVERQYEKIVGSKARDQMIVRRWPAGKGYAELEDLSDDFPWDKMEAPTSSGGSGGKVGDLPLPLLTRSFNKEVFNVKLLAWQLLECHKEKQTYDPLRWNCYWYAARVFELHRVSFGHVKDRVWKFASWKGMISKIWDPIRHHKAVKAAAEGFKKFMKGHPIADPPGRYDHTRRINIDGAQDALLKYLREEFSKQLVEMTDEEKQMADDIKRYHLDIKHSIEAETKREDFEANYERRKEIPDRQDWNWNKSVNNEPFLEGPTKDELSELERCLWAFLGRLFKELKQPKVQEV
jgi:hypothetical protein